MDASQKKTLLIKLKAVGRVMKEYGNYKAEVEAFDQTLVAQDKKQGEFFKESIQALDAVKKNLIDYVIGLESYISENKEVIDNEDDPAICAQMEKGNSFIQKAKELFPAEL